MQPSESLYLVLGCFGRNDDGFISCSGLENRILSINEQVDHYNEIMDYFDSCRLFDKPMFEFNAVAHFIKNMQGKFDQVTFNKRLWSEKQYNLYQKFIIDHRFCGLYVKLLLTDNKEESIKFNEKSVFIKAQSEQKQHTPKFLFKTNRWSNKPTKKT